MMSTMANTMDNESEVFLVVSSLFYRLEVLYLRANGYLATTYQCVIIHVAVLLLLVYFAFYWLKVVHKPTVYGDRNSGLAAYLLSKCPILSQYYWPTFWCWHFHLCTIAREILQKCPRLLIRRQVLQLCDGGVLALDWIEGHGDSHQFKGEAPIVIIVPGVTGSSDANYTRNLALDALSQGCRPVVYHNRGLGGLSLTTAKLFAMNSTSDLRSALVSIRSQYPKAPLIGFGVSYGGGLLTWYLIESGSESLLSAVAVFCSIWDLNDAVSYSEERIVLRKIYNSSAAASFKTVISRDAHILKQDPRIEVDKAMKELTVSAIDNWITAPVFGYSGKDEYYAAGIIHPWHIGQIKVPFVNYSSSDDKFCRYKTIPVHSFEDNPLTAFVKTQCGGHMGFLEGMLPKSMTWLNRAARQFLAAMQQDLAIADTTGSFPKARL